MKKTILAVLGVFVSASLAGAAGVQYETNRMEGGKLFAEQQVKGTLNGQAAPVRISGEFKPVETAKYNAKAKDYSKLETKAPPALKDSAADPKGVSPTTVGAVAGGLAGAGFILVTTALAVATGCATVGAAGFITVTAIGAGIGYGVAAGTQWVRNQVSGK